MPTALDSGIISRAGPRSELKAQLQSAVAHQLSVPITTFAPDYVQRLRHLLDAANLEEIMISMVSNPGMSVDEVAQRK